MKSDVRFVSILGIKFLAEGYPVARQLLDNGALMVVPAAPALATIEKDKFYYEALRNSDFALPDSGLMVLLVKYTSGIHLKKLSGLAFLRHFLEEPILRNEKCLFLIDPDNIDKKLNHKYLISRGIRIDPSDHYVAPIYRSNLVEDPKLLKILENKKPKYILINIGGGIQEKLGFYLINNLSYRPGIICTGAAISFLTHKQIPIPPIFDSLHLGWLLRCIHNPRRFIPRYLKAFSFIPIFFRNMDLK